MPENDITELQTLDIYQLTEDQYAELLESSEFNPDALYMTPASNVVTSVNGKTPNSSGNVDISATNINYSNSVSGLSATSVQDAIDKVDANAETIQADVNERVKANSTITLSGWHNMFPYRLDTNYIYIYLNGYYAFPPTSSPFTLTVSGSLSMDSGKDFNGATNSGTITVKNATQHPTGVEI